MSRHPKPYKNTSPSVYGFLVRVGLLCLVPLLPVIVAYLVLDPFKVLRAHSDYYSDGIGKNKGVVTLRTFDEGNPVWHYDSFIIGSSVSCHYPVEEWKKYLPEGAVPFHLDSSNQTIHCTRLYVEYLDTHAYAIRDVLWVLSPFILELRQEEQPQGCAIPPALLPSDVDKALFQYDYFRIFATEGFLKAYLPWLLTGRKTDDVSGRMRVFELQPVVYDPQTNEERLPEWDAAIASDREAFYAEHTILTPPSDAPYRMAPESLSDADKEDLRAIASILKRHNARLKIIMAPELSLTVPNRADTEFFSALFGDNYVDLTREFRSELQEPANFYDNTHYRPVLAAKFMRRAYN